MLSVLEIMTKSLGEGFRESRNKWRFTCPKCNSYRTLHFNPNKSGGPFICTACGFRGNVKLIANSMGELIKDSPIPEKKVDWSLLHNIYSSILTNGSVRPAHVDWLYTRGIDANLSNCPTPAKLLVRSSDLLLSKIRSLFTDEELIESGLLVNTSRGIEAAGIMGYNRILIPYFNSKGECVYIRSRFAGKSEYKYLAPIGVPARGFSWGWETYDPLLKYTIITEGELKAQAAKQLGFQCIALPGMQTGHTYFADQCVRMGVKKVYILFDTEGGTTSTGISKQLGVDRCAENLTTELVKRSIEVKRCHLPLLGKEKMDIDSFVLLKGSSAKKELIKVLKN